MLFTVTKKREFLFAFFRLEKTKTFFFQFFVPAFKKSNCERFIERSWYFRFFFLSFKITFVIALPLSVKNNETKLLQIEVSNYLSI